MTLILSLIAAALVAIFFEVLLPGGVLGVIAAICVLAATWVAGGTYGWVAGAGVFIGCMGACLVVTILAFKVFSKTKYGQRFFLKTVVSGHTREPDEAAVLIGKQGRTRTRLNPSGMVTIDGASYEGFSRDGYLEADQPVEVVGKDNFKLILKKL